MNRLRGAPSNGTAYRRAPGTGRRIGYFCRQCSVSQVTDHVPPGWYLLQRCTDTPRSDGPGFRHHRLGAFCSATCLAEAMAEIVRGEQEMGSEWQVLTQS